MFKYEQAVEISKYHIPDLEKTCSIYKALANLDIRGLARPALRALADGTGESCHLAVLHGKKSMRVKVADSPLPTAFPRASAIS